MMKKNKTYLVVVVCMAILFGSCYTIGDRLTEGAGAGLKKVHGLDSIVYSLTKNAELGLSDSVAQRKLRVAIDSLITSLGRGVNKQLDTLLVNPVIKQQLQSILIGLKDSLLSKRTSMQIQNIVSTVREDLIGAQTQKSIRALIASAIDQLGSDSTQIQIKKLREILLGEETKKKIASIVDSTSLVLSTQLNNKIFPKIDQQVDFIQKRAGELLIALALLALLIIGYVWYQKSKYVKLVSMLTYQIHETPNQEHYDELTRRIRKKAQEQNLEGTLRKHLSNQGILGHDAWVH